MQLHFVGVSSSVTTEESHSMLTDDSMKYERSRMCNNCIVTSNNAVSSKRGDESAMGK